MKVATLCALTGCFLALAHSFRLRTPTGEPGAEVRAAGIGPGPHLSGSGTAASPAEPAVLKDDLGWLVGSWVCVTRWYLRHEEHMIGSDAEDLLAYLNVYFPYADDHLTLELTNDPERRRIAAEFLVLRAFGDGRGNFVEGLEPMSPLGSVRIGKSTIRYGNPPIEDVEFRYKLERRGDWFWLVLDSNLVHLELIKTATRAGAIGASHVVAPIKDFTPAHISELETRYEAIKREALNGASSHPAQSNAPKGP